MRLKSIACLLVVCLLFGQTISIAAQAASSAASPVAGSVLTIPPGTVVPLTLVTPIKRKSTKPGDTVRAQVAFPVTIGTQLAIPAGTYVEGVIVSVAAKKTRTNPGGLQIHFTTMLFANGYRVALDGMNTQAEVVPPVVSPLGPTGALGLGFGWGGDASPLPVGLHPMVGQNPTPQSLPPLPGPPKAFLIAVAIIGAISIATLLYFLLHYGNGDYLAYDSGYQFQMALTTPVTVNTAQVNAAATVPAH